jgi:hypothetical protein
MAHQEKWGPTSFQVILDPTDLNPWIQSRDVRILNLRAKLKDGDILKVFEYYGQQPGVLEWDTNGEIQECPLDSMGPTRYTITMDSLTDPATAFISFTYADTDVSNIYRTIPQA